MIKYKKYGYWYTQWDTYNKKASQNRKLQWWIKNIQQQIQIITKFKN